MQPRMRTQMKRLAWVAFAGCLSLNLLGCSSSGSGTETTGTGGSGNSGGSSSTTSTGGASAAGTSTSVQGQLGTACTASSQCSGHTSLSGVCMTSWPGGGYCSTDACPTSAECGAQGVCADDGSGTNRCLLACVFASQCRTGYTCSSGGCIPTS